ncbi:MAG TPA: hypothetical protein VJT09_07105 [Pyrinomonadaceae bacterium]|nr:hypothetical protein [Pyrinomonadaceae bacterium]
MGDKQEDANLILRLYEIRREEAMRKARNWFMNEFNPESTQDIFKVLVGEHSADFRMVASYWDMVAAFVNHGTIDEELFNDINTEHVAIYAKLQPFLAEIRAMPGVPPYLYLKSLEPLVLRMPDAEERVASMRRYMKMRAEASAGASSS